MSPRLVPRCFFFIACPFLSIADRSFPSISPSPLSSCKSFPAHFHILVFLLAVLVSGEAVGSPPSNALIQEGAQDLGRGQLKQALKKFEKAAHVDPGDSQAVFFQGVALNRLGRSGQAFERLQQARQMGARHPDLDFELGWSLINLQRFGEAIAALKSYEQHSPGRGQTSEFLGRASYALGNYDRAEQFLLQAIEHDPKLTATSQLFLALVAKARGDQEIMARHLASMVEDSPDSPLSRRLQEQAELLTGVSRAGSSAFRLVASAIGGYNDNVVALGKGVNLPADISSKDANYFQGSLDASYAYGVTEQDTVIAGYRFLSTVYAGLSSFDLIDHFIYVDLRHAFNPKLTGTLRVSDEFTQVGGNNFRNQVGVRPAVAWRMVDWNIVELAYGFFSGNYLLPTTTVFDRDSATNTIAVTDYFRIPGWPLQGRLGYFRSWNDADGGDFDFKTDGLVAGLTTYLLPQLTGDVFYARTWDRYDNLNSLLKAYARYDHVAADSNIIFFDYDQNSFSGGLVVLIN